MADQCEMCGDAVTDGGSGRDHDTYDCAGSLLRQRNDLRSQLSAALAKVAELKSEVTRRKAHELACMNEMAKARRAAQDAQGARDIHTMIGMQTSDEFVAGSLVKRLYDRGRELEQENASLRRYYVAQQLVFGADQESESFPRLCRELDAAKAELERVKGP